VGFRSLAAVAALGVWLLAGALVAAATYRGPVSPGSAVAGGACQVLAWGLIVAVTGVAAATMTGRSAAGGIVGLAVIVLAGWQHRLPSWCAPNLIDRLLAMPPAGEIRPLNDGWSPAAATWWAATWILADVTAVIIVAALARPHLGGPFHPRQTRTARGYVAAAVATVAVVVTMTAMLAGLATDGPATLGAAASFLTANEVPLGAALLVGLLAHTHDLGPRPALALFAALALDTVAGLLAHGDAWTGPQRLGLSPTAEWGQWGSPTMILALAAITLASCAALAVIAPLARALERLQGRPGTALALGLIANTVDAAATQIGLNNGAIAEANPVVRLTGLAEKWAAVTVLLLVLHRLRPSTVWIAATAYALVVAYHALGVALLA
jgi:hypothetical protein